MLQFRIPNLHLSFCECFGKMFNNFLVTLRQYKNTKNHKLSVSSLRSYQRLAPSCFGNQNPQTETNEQTTPNSSLNTNTEKLRYTSIYAKEELMDSRAKQYNKFQDAMIITTVEPPVTNVLLKKLLWDTKQEWLNCTDEVA